MTKDMLELAERCEKATEADLDISHAIGRAIFGPTYRYEPFTASLDAAMTLLPDEHEGMSFVWAKEGRWSLCLYNSDIMAGGANRALALCAAALRARANNQGG